MPDRKSSRSSFGLAIVIDSLVTLIISEHIVPAWFKIVKFFLSRVASTFCPLRPHALRHRTFP